MTTITCSELLGSRIASGLLEDGKLPFEFLLKSRRGFLATFELLPPPLPFDVSCDVLLALDEFRLSEFE